MTYTSKKRESAFPFFVKALLAAAGVLYLLAIFCFTMAAVA